MKGNINLSSLLGHSEKESEHRQEAQKEKNQQISVDYLTTLNELAGPKIAMNIALGYTPEELIEMESKYDRFRFDSQPKTAKGKLERILKFLEWEKDFHDVTSMSYYMENITESFSGFQNLIQKIIASEDSEVMNFNPFIRDQLNGVARNLLSTYGVKPTSENKKTGHLAREINNSPKKIVPGITTNDLIDLLIEKKKARTPVNEYAIVEGFDNARTAMEVATMTRDNSDARKYVKNGFTSLEQVNAVSLKKLTALEEAFDFSGNWDSHTYHEKNLTRFVSSYIHGKPERVNEMIELAQNGGQEYLIAFNGSVAQAKRILKISAEKRPSANAVKYAKSILKVHKFKDTVALAKEIDSSHKDIFDSKFETKEEFLTFREDYELTLKDFIEKTGKKADENGDVASFHYNAVKDFKGDLRFISTDISIINTYKTITKIEGVMDFDTYQGLNVSWKSELITTLIDEGYTAVQMKEAFGSQAKVNGYELQENLKELKNNMSLAEMAEIFTNDVNTDYAVNMLSVVSFKKKGIPYGVLNSLEAHNVQPQEFKSFIDTVGISKYQPTEEDIQAQKTIEPSFDAMNMIKDFKVFYNQETWENK